MRVNISALIGLCFSLVLADGTDRLITGPTLPSLTVFVDTFAGPVDVMNATLSLGEVVSVIFKLEAFLEEQVDEIQPINAGLVDASSAESKTLIGLLVDHENVQKQANFHPSYDESAVDPSNQPNITSITDQLAYWNDRFYTMQEQRRKLQHEIHLKVWIADQELVLASDLRRDNDPADLESLLNHYTTVAYIVSKEFRGFIADGALFRALFVFEKNLNSALSGWRRELKSNGSTRLGFTTDARHRGRPVAPEMSSWDGLARPSLCQRLMAIIGRGRVHPE